MSYTTRQYAAYAAIAVGVMGIIVYGILSPAPPSFNPLDAMMTPVRSAEMCISPPLLSHSVAPEAKLTYRILASVSSDVVSADACVRRAFDTWNAVLHNEGARIEFVYEPDATQQTNLVVSFTALPEQTGGAITQVHRGNDGYLNSVGILINNNKRTTSSCLGYYKITLHEIGHVLGLGHPNFEANNESSVMNNMEEPNDRSNEIPQMPTVCDVEQVRAASAAPRFAISQ